MPRLCWLLYSMSFRSLIYGCLISPQLWDETYFILNAQATLGISLDGYALGVFSFFLQSGLKQFGNGKCTTISLGWAAEQAKFAFIQVIVFIILLRGTVDPELIPGKVGVKRGNITPSCASYKTWTWRLLHSTFKYTRKPLNSNLEKPTFVDVYWTGLSADGLRTSLLLINFTHSLSHLRDTSASIFHWINHV